MSIVVAEKTKSAPAKGRRGRRGNAGPSIPAVVKRAFTKHDAPAGPETDTRVLTFYSVINTTTGSSISGAYGSGLATSATEFASMAARYQEFRVLAMKLRWCPRYGQSNESCNVDESGQPIGAVFTGGIAPGGVAPILAYEKFIVSSAVSKHLMIEADYRVNPTALLWAPATGGPPAANQFGIVVRHPGTCPANLNNRNCVDVYVEFVTEWRTAS